jgi:hypothetical protein
MCTTGLATLGFFRFGESLTLARAAADEVAAAAAAWASRAAWAAASAEVSVSLLFSLIFSKTNEVRVVIGCRERSCQNPNLGSVAV